jgi:hypothetical protein
MSNTLYTNCMENQIEIPLDIRHHMLKEAGFPKPCHVRAYTVQPLTWRLTWLRLLQPRMNGEVFTEFLSRFPILSFVSQLAST